MPSCQQTASGRPLIPPSPTSRVEPQRDAAADAILALAGVLSVFLRRLASACLCFQNAATPCFVRQGAVDVHRECYSRQRPKVQPPSDRVVGNRWPASAAQAPVPSSIPRAARGSPGGIVRAQRTTGRPGPPRGG